MKKERIERGKLRMQVGKIVNRYVSERDNQVSESWRRENGN